MNRARLSAWLLAAAAVSVAVGIGLVLAAQSDAGTEAAPSTTTTIPRTSTTVATTPPTTEAPPGRNEAVLAIPVEPDTINPFLTGGTTATVRRIGALYLASAFRHDATTGDPLPGIVRELPTEDNGGLVRQDDGTVRVRLEVDPRAVWEDGTPVTAADLAFTYEVITDPLLPIVAPMRERHAAIDPDSVVAEGLTLSFTVAEASLDVYEMFPVILPRHQVEGTDFVEEWNTRAWYSAGPFRLVGWTPGDELRFDRNPRYWRTDPETGTPLPLLDRIVFEIEDDRALAFARRRIDVATFPAPAPDVVAQLSGLDGVDMAVRYGPDWEHLGFQFGPTRFEVNPASLTNSTAFRRALGFLIDREHLARLAYGDLGVPTDSIVEVGWPRHEGAPWAAYRPDLVAARRELGAAAEEVGVDLVAQPPRIVLTTTDSERRRQMAEAIAAMLEPAGIDVEIRLERTGFFFRELVTPGRFEVAAWAWEATPGPAGAARDLYNRFVRLPEDGGRNFYRFTAAGTSAGERFAAVMEDVRSTLDLEDLERRLVEAEAFLAGEAVVIPLYATPVVTFVWADELGGYVATDGAIPDTATAENWFRLDR